MGIRFIGVNDAVRGIALGKNQRKESGIGADVKDHGVFGDGDQVLAGNPVAENSVLDNMLIERRAGRDPVRDPVAAMDRDLFFFDRA